MSDLIHKLAKAVTPDGEKIGTMIAKVAKQVVVLGDLIVLAAACVTVHAIVHGNVTPARDLLLAIKAGRKSMFRSNDLIKWFVAVGPFSYNEKDEVLNYDRAKIVELKAAYEADPIAFASKLVSTPFNVANQQKPYQGFNFLKELAKLVKRGEKAAKDHGADERTVLAGMDEARVLLG